MAIFNDMNGINVASGFKLQAPFPIDPRFVVETITDRDALVTENGAYEGMQVYVKKDNEGKELKKTYVLKDLINNDWKLSSEVGKNVEGLETPIDHIYDEETDGLISSSSIVIGKKGGEIFNNYDGGKYTGDLTPNDEDYPEEFDLLGSPYPANAATGLYSTTMGAANQSSGAFTFTAGYKNVARARATTAFGRGNEVNARYGFGTGYFNKIYANASFTYGVNVEAGSAAGLPEGKDSSSTQAAFAGGLGSKATGSYSVALGKNCIASGVAAFAVGNGAVADNSSGSYAIGSNVTASGHNSIAGGLGSKALAQGAIALGVNVTAETQGAIAMGNGVTASGESAIAFGGVADDATTYTCASGKNSFAAGSGTQASGKSSFATGYKTKANGSNSFAAGYASTADADNSVAFGYATVTKGNNYSMAVGESVKTTAPYQLVTGKFNELGDDTLIHIIGNGTDGSHRSNAYTLDKNGNGWYAGGITIGNNDVVINTNGITINEHKVATLPEIEGYTDLQISRYLCNDDNTGIRIGKIYENSNGIAIGNSKTEVSVLGIAIGNNSKSLDSGVAIGNDSKCDGDGGAIGLHTCAGDGFSGGKNAGVRLGTGQVYIDAIQLGTGLNNTPKTLQVYDYQLMDSNGNIPIERLELIKEYIDEKLGDVETAINKIIEIQNSLAGGGETV